ncbi:MAG: sulfurtransferase [Candidatus Nitrosocaldus sp.]|nr:sulfurtransferase [Candidatus Nitrosocaldus sp.]MDW8275126.1 sulfurtransferase [Candidatus Nitrosocaldus sp.]
MLITPVELRQMLERDRDRDKVLIVDARSWHEYRSGHVPGAVNMDLFAFHWADTSPEGIEGFNSSLEMLLRSTGVTYDKRIVFYDDITGTLAARGLWLMHYISHNDAMVLDGGLSWWVRQGYELEDEPSRPSPVHGGYTYRFNGDVLATYRYILERLGDPNVRMVDARSSEEYHGLYVRASRGGHIPGAVNVNWEMNVMRDGRMKPVEQLRRVYSSILYSGVGGQGGDEGRKGRDDYEYEHEIICYCQGGYRAAHAYLALRLLGINHVRVYLGSWYEWGNRHELPVE